jgi:peptidoglycan hydrolase-like protein with peptidoglycan-binding domain
MSMLGSDVIDVGRGKVGQRYILGARAPLNNPNWNGPWDCAEFASWCAFQAYRIPFGVSKTRDIADADPFSGFWFQDADKPGIRIPWRDALAIRGAFLIRKPKPGKIGHVAISMGDGKRTLEARGRADGVGIFEGQENRGWDIGALLPGVDYDGDDSRPVEPARAAAGGARAVLPKPQSFPPGFLALTKPIMKGAPVVALQRALTTKNCDPGPLDGEFGRMTETALIAFQTEAGLEVDGIAGPMTAAALGLAWPISGTAADAAVLQRNQQPQTVTVREAAVATDIDLVTNVALADGLYRATTAGGFSFPIGQLTRYTDDMHRVGLFQSARVIAGLAAFGSYKGADFAPRFGGFAHLIEPTLTAEGGGRFATLNTYDRAAFTFGAPQLAAHTPGENLILYVRALLALPNATKHLPDMALRDNGSGKQTVHAISGGRAVDLEKPEQVTRPNGIVETQLRGFMTTLNPSATAIDAAECLAAARLMNWVRIDPLAREAQIAVFIDAAKAKLARAETRIPALAQTDWAVSLWVMDILHQGRGRFAMIAAAVASSNPERALAMIGADRYPARIRAVKAGVAQLRTSGLLNGFDPWNA